MNMIAGDDSMGVITVSFHPDMPLLRAQAVATVGFAAMVIVDNGSTVSECSALSALAAEFPHVRCVYNDTNRGLAAAVNQGAENLRERIPVAWLCILDQDSDIDACLLAGLRTGCKQAMADTGKACAVGPSLIDASTGLDHGFHVIDGLRWSRVHPGAKTDALQPLASLNGSGTLMPSSMFYALGGLDATLFIDHVDTDFSFRALAAGYGLFGLPWLSMNHRMGERGRRVWRFGWRVVPERSPARLYFLSRNTMLLMVRSYVPAVWKFWAMVKLVGDFAANGCNPRRWPAFAAMSRGVAASFRDG